MTKPLKGTSTAWVVGWTCRLSSKCVNIYWEYVFSYLQVIYLKAFCYSGYWLQQDWQIMKQLLSSCSYHDKKTCFSFVKTHLFLLQLFFLGELSVQSHICEGTCRILEWGLCIGSCYLQELFSTVITEVHMKLVDFLWPLNDCLNCQLLIRTFVPKITICECLAMASWTLPTVDQVLISYSVFY